jgi:hypothetical protein
VKRSKIDPDSRSQIRNTAVVLGPCPWTRPAFVGIGALQFANNIIVVSTATAAGGAPVGREEFLALLSQIHIATQHIRKKIK